MFGESAGKRALSFLQAALADALLRTATEDAVGVLSVKHPFDTARVRAALAKHAEALYAHPTQGLQRVAMYAVGAWTPMRGHPDVWRMGR